MLPAVGPSPKLIEAIEPEAAGGLVDSGCALESRLQGLSAVPLIGTWKTSPTVAVLVYTQPKYSASGC